MEDIDKEDVELKNNNLHKKLKRKKEKVSQLHHDVQTEIGRHNRSLKEIFNTINKTKNTHGGRERKRRKRNNNKNRNKRDKRKNGFLYHKRGEKKREHYYRISKLSQEIDKEDVTNKLDEVKSKKETANRVFNNEYTQLKNSLTQSLRKIENKLKVLIDKLDDLESL